MRNIVTVLSVLFSATLGIAETVELSPAKDNTLYQDEEGRFSNGAGQHLFAGKTGKDSIRRGLVAFDVATALPAGITVRSVELTLHMSRSISETESVELRPMLADWGEGDSDARVQEGAGIEAAVGDVTWTQAFSGGAAWERSGGVFTETAGAAQAVGDVGFYTWESTAQLVSDVQQWLDDPQANFGWVILGNEEVKTTAKRFDSREHEDPTVRPVLRIEFDPPAATAVAARSWGNVKDD